MQVVKRSINTRKPHNNTYSLIFQDSKKCLGNTKAHMIEPSLTKIKIVFIIFYKLTITRDILSLGTYKKIRTANQRLSQNALSCYVLLDNEKIIYR